MKTYILNIGFKRNDNGENGRYKPGVAVNTKGALFNALRLVGICPVDTNYHDSDTEETAVLRFDKRPTHADVLQLCDLLAQDCIAMLTFPGTGTLIGPKAKKWGPFNPDLFIMPDGSRYSTVTTLVP